MRQDWIEFITDKEAKNCKAVCLRPEYIIAIQDRANKGTRLTYDCNTETASIDITEPYGQVKQKIMDAERPINLDDVAVERFTRDEYELLLNSVGYFEAACNDTKENIEFAKRLEPLAKLKSELNKILKEEK